MARFYNRLSVKQFMVTLLVALVLGLVFGAAQVLYDLQRERLRVDERYENMLSLVLDSARQAGYELDDVLARRVTQGLLQERTVHQARLVDDRNLVLAQESRPLHHSGYQWLVDYLFSDEILYTRRLIQDSADDLYVGTLEVEADPHLLAADFVERSRAVLTLTIVYVLILALFLTLLFYILLTAPLQQLILHLSRFGQEGRKEQLSRPYGHQDDELGLLVDTFNNIWGEREAALSEVERSYAYASTIIEQAGDALFLVDEDGLMCEINNQACVLLGYSAEQLNSCNILELHQDCDAVYLKELLSSLPVGEPVTLSVTMCNHLNHTFPVETRLIVLDLFGMRKALLLARDITERKRAEAQINFLAYYDGLTELPNRVLLLDRLRQAFAYSKAHKFVGALLLIDIDRFKNINDSLGHETGDRLLQAVAQRLDSWAVNNVTCARLGGDEFAVLLPEVGLTSPRALDQAQEAAQHLLELLAQPLTVDHQELFVTVSMGITLFPEVGDSAESLLQQADSALYRAKDQGRNNYNFYHPGMQKAADQRLDLQRGLNRALIDEEFELFYQAQTNHKGELVGAEALIRWHDPQRGYISPGQFIPAAEDSGLIIRIGSWVLDTALAQVRDWLDRGVMSGHFHYLSVNVSPLQFQQDDFIAQLAERLDFYNVDACHLELELTESMLMNHVELAAEKLRKLQEMGIRLALDDFGTGYSSLSYLKHLPLNMLKIDQSFVRDMLEDANDEAIIETIVMISRTMQLDLIAEGVETRAQRDALERMGCQLYQGYLFSRPLPLTEFESYIARTNGRAIKVGG